MNAVPRTTHCRGRGVPKPLKIIFVAPPTPITTMPRHAPATNDGAIQLRGPKPPTTMPKPMATRNRPPPRISGNRFPRPAMKGAIEMTPLSMFLVKRHVGPSARAIDVGAVACWSDGRPLGSDLLCSLNSRELALAENLFSALDDLRCGQTASG